MSGATAPISPAGRRAVLQATVLGSSMAFIDGTVVNVALPVIQERLGANASQVQWVVEAYAVVLAALLLVGGSLGDLYGRRRIFGLGVVAFAMASALCGLAPDADWLIIGRGLQGVGGALLVPGSLALIHEAFPPDERAAAIGIWSGMTAVTTAAGPVLGGWLVDAISWRAIFWINLPVAVLTLIPLLTRVPRCPGTGALRPDWAGAILGAVGLGGLAWGLNEAGRLGFDSGVVQWALAGGALGLVAFVVREATAEAPMMPLSLFRSRVFAVINLMTLLLYAGLSGVIFLLPFLLIRVHDWSATEAGAALLPFVICLSVMSRRVGALADRHGARLYLTAGALLTGLGFGLLSWLPGSGGYLDTWLPGIAAMGVGMGLCVAPLTAAVMGAAPAGLSGVASGVNNAVSRMSMALAIALFGLLVQAAFDAEAVSRLEAIEASEPAREVAHQMRSQWGAITLPEAVPEAERAQVSQALDTAFGDAVRRSMGAAVWLALLAALAAFLGLRAPRGPGPVRS